MTSAYAIPPGDWLTHLRRETDSFASVASISPLAAHVPAYPDFTVETLSAHIGRALRIFAPLISAEPGSEEGPPAGQAVIDWLRAGLEPLLTALREVSPDKLVSFPHRAGERPAGLIAPLLAVEVGVHRWDVESVLGEHAAIPAELAGRAIDSVFENFVPRLASSGVEPIGGTLRLRASDTDASWRVSTQDGRLIAGRDHGDSADATTEVSATAENLALLVWKRKPLALTGAQVTGDAGVLRRFLTVDYVPDPRTTAAH